MKIMNAMFSTVYGGVEQVFLDYDAVLTQQGHDIIPVIHPWAAVRKQCNSDRLKTMFSYGSNDVIASYRLKRLLEHESPDAIITHTRRAAKLFQRTQTSIPKIAVCHDPQLFPILNQTSDAIITITEAMRE